MVRNHFSFSCLLIYSIDLCCLFFRLSSKHVYLAMLYSVNFVNHFSSQKLCRRHRLWVPHLMCFVKYKHIYWKAQNKMLGCSRKKSINETVNVHFKFSYKQKCKSTGNRWCLWRQNGCDAIWRHVIMKSCNIQLSNLPKS